MAMISEEHMQRAEHWFCLPLVMLINFSLFQYLLVMYFKRRSEVRIVLLLVCAFLSFSVLIPQAYPHDQTVGHLNDISETCSTLTFLIQIIIIGRDIERKVRIRSLKMLTWAAEVLTMLGLLVVLLNWIEVMAPDFDISQFDGLDNIVENISLFFVLISRFTYIAMSRGIKWMLANKKFELLLYVLFVTHELPFMGMEAATGVSWEPVQAVWHRVTLMMCILLTIKEKLSSKRTKASKEQTTRGGFSRGPSMAQKPVDEESSEEPEATKTPRKCSIHLKTPAIFSGATKTKKKEDKTATSAATTRVSSLTTIVRSGLSSMRVMSIRSGGRSGRVMSVTPGPPRPGQN